MGLLDEDNMVAAAERGRGGTEGGRGEEVNWRN